MSTRVGAFGSGGEGYATKVLARFIPAHCNRDIWPSTLLPCGCDYSTMIRSAHSTNDTKIAGLPNFAPQSFKSVSVTPRAREQAPQAKTGMCLATTLSNISVSGGQPTGSMTEAVAFRIRYVASPRRKI